MLSAVVVYLPPTLSPLSRALPSLPCSLTFSNSLTHPPSQPLQGLLLAVLVYTGVVTNDSWTTYDKRNVATGIQEFLICIEMFVAALAFAYAFPPRVSRPNPDSIPPSLAPPSSSCSSCLSCPVSSLFPFVSFSPQSLLPFSPRAFLPFSPTLLPSTFSPLSTPDPQDYMHPDEVNQDFWTNVTHMFDLRDVAEDLSEVGPPRSHTHTHTHTHNPRSVCLSLSLSHTLTLTHVRASVFFLQVVDSHRTQMMDTAAETTQRVWKLPRHAVTAAVTAAGAPVRMIQMLSRTR